MNAMTRWLARDKHLWIPPILLAVALLAYFAWQSAHAVPPPRDAFDYSAH